MMCNNEKWHEEKVLKTLTICWILCCLCWWEWFCTVLKSWMLRGPLLWTFIFIILVDDSRYLSRMSWYIFPFILPAIIWNVPVPYTEKQSHAMMFPPPTSLLVWCFWGEAVWPPYTVCIMAIVEVCMLILRREHVTQCSSPEFVDRGALLNMMDYVEL